MRALEPVAALALLTAALLVPAIANGFPLIFPDSGTYLAIAFGPEYAIDRSSVYGLLLKPLVGLAPGVAGLWIAIAVQALLVGGVVLAAAAALTPGRPPLMLAAWLLLAVLLTSLPWHAGQFMPDALSGPLILTTWLLVSRPFGANGSVLLWALTVALAATHYTHPVILAATAFAALLGHALTGTAFRTLVRQALAPIVACVAAVLVLIGMNGLALGQWRMSPLGSAFLFARLNEDGLVRPWLDRDCARRDPSPICAERDRLPVDSQIMLWGDPESVVARHIWGARTPGERWTWAAAFAEANRGAIVGDPLGFGRSALRGSVGQLLTFRALDDECPARCGDAVSGIGQKLLQYRPETYPALQASAQRRGTTPKALVRAVTTPIAALALLLLPVATGLAWRRRDPLALSLSAGIMAALLVNAAMAGALSDIHDRYQSRIMWLAPLALLLIALRWRDQRRT